MTLSNGEISSDNTDKAVFFPIHYLRLITLNVPGENTPMHILHQMEIFVSKLYYKGKRMWKLRE